MARGPRKTAKEKLLEALDRVENEIEQYETLLDNKRAEQTELELKLKRLEVEELSGVLDNYGLSIQEVKQLIEASAKDF